MDFQKRLWPVEVVLAHLPQGAVGFVELLLQMEGPGGEEEDGLVVAAGEIAAITPVFLNWLGDERFPRILFEEILAPLPAEGANRRDIGVAQFGGAQA